MTVFSFILFDFASLYRARFPRFCTFDQAYWYAANNQLQNGNGLWGDDTFTQDGVGNLTWHTNDLGGTVTTDQQIYSSSKNQLTGIERNGTTIRTFSHDGAGNLLSDVQGGVTTTYAYNNANRMASFTKGSVTTGTYTCNARGQLVIRNVTNSSNFIFLVASRFISTTNRAM